MTDREVVLTWYCDISFWMICLDFNTEWCANPEDPNDYTWIIIFECCTFPGLNCLYELFLD